MSAPKPKTGEAPSSPEQRPREESATFSPSREGAINSPPREVNGRKFESPRFGSVPPAGSPAKQPFNVLARVGAFQAKQDATRKLPPGTVQGPSVLPSSRLYQSILETEINSKSEPASDVPILEFLKAKFPSKPSKWAGWAELLGKLDIDTTNDVRDLTPEIWNGLEISPVLRCGLETLRQPSEVKAPTATPALKQLTESLQVTDSKGRVGEFQKLWPGSPQTKLRLPEQFQEAQQRLKPSPSPAKQTPSKMFLQEPVRSPHKFSPVKRTLNYFPEESLASDLLPREVEEASNKSNNNEFSVDVSAPALLAAASTTPTPDSPSSSSFNPSGFSSASCLSSSCSSSSSFAPFSGSSSSSTSSSSAKPTPVKRERSDPEAKLVKEVFGQSPKKFGSPKSPKPSSSSSPPKPTLATPPAQKKSSLASPGSSSKKRKSISFAPSPTFEKAKSPRSEKGKKTTPKKSRSDAHHEAAAVLAAFKSQPSLAQRDEEEGDEEEGELEEGYYIVNCIKARRWSKKRQHFEYLINWKGFDDCDNTWEPPSSLLPNLGWMIAEFDEKAKHTQKREKAEN